MVGPSANMVAWAAMHSHEIIIKDVRVFDGVGRVREHATVVIRDDRIAAIEETRSAKKTPAGARTVDGRGLTLLPGLIDCHVHLCLGAEPDVVQTIRDESPAFTLLKAAEYARRTLEAGFTTVRDLGFRDHGIFGLKQAIAAQLMPGPRIMAAGLAVCMTGGHARFIGRQAD